MTKTTNYEVQVQQGGRWSIHARFPGRQKDAAIEEGKQLDKLSAIDSVKVIKEVYDPDREKHSEYTVYKSSGTKSHTGKSSTENKDESWLGRSGGSDEAGSAAEEAVPAVGKKAKRRNRRP